MILSCGHLQEVPALQWLRNLYCVERGEDLGATLSSLSSCRYLTSELTSLSKAKCCAKYALI